MNLLEVKKELKLIPETLKISNKPSDYKILSNSSCDEIRDVDDQQEFQNLLKEMSALDFTNDEKKTLFSGIAAILHIGNIDFQESEDKMSCSISDSQSIESKNYGY